MRSISRSLLVFVFVLVSSAAAIAQGAPPSGQQPPGPTQINPGNQINWPLPTCSNPNAVYNPATNACVDLTQQPTSNIKWPMPDCASGVYSPAGNTCVSTGSANNPGGASGDIQVNAGGNFGKATVVNMATALSDNQSGGASNYVVSKYALPYWPFPQSTSGNPSATMQGNLIWGYQAGNNMGNYAGLLVSTTGSGTNGSTSLTVASTTGAYLNRLITGVGIQAGTTIGAINTGTSVLTLNKPLTQTLTNSPVTYDIGATGDAIIIGRYACSACAEVNGAVIIGVGAEQAYTGQGAGGEEGNFVALGPFAMQNATSNFESVAIGNKACMLGSYFSGTVCIGNHIAAPSGTATQTDGGVYVGSSIGWTMGNEGAYVTSVGSILVGGSIFSFPGMNVTPGNYTITRETILGSNAGQCLFNTTANTVLGGGVAIGGGCSVAGTVPTAHNNIFIGDGGNQQPGANLTTAAYNTFVGVTPFGSGLVGAPGYSVTSGSYNVGMGSGALGAIASASSATGVGVNAAANATVQVDAFGANALQKMTTGTANVGVGSNACGGLLTGSGNTCLGPSAGGSTTSGGVVTGSNNVFIGNSAGLVESPAISQVTYVGSGSTGRRNSFGSLGSNEAVGYAEFAGTGTGTEQYDVFIGDTSNCTGCASSISIGHTANLGAVSHAIQMDAGTNNTSNTWQWGTLNWMDTTGNASFKTISVLSVPTIASAATIAPTSRVTKVSGTVTVTSITPPTVAQNGGVFLGCMIFIPTGAWATATGGNIAKASTMVVNQPNEICYDGTSWYPSY